MSFIGPHGQSNWHGPKWVWYNLNLAQFRFWLIMFKKSIVHLDMDLLFLHLKSVSQTLYLSKVNWSLSVKNRFLLKKKKVWKIDKMRYCSHILTINGLVRFHFNCTFSLAWNDRGIYSKTYFLFCFWIELLTLT